MKNFNLALLALASSAAAFCSYAPEKIPESRLTANTSNTIPACLQKYLTAYPGQFQRATANSLIWQDGTEMIFDDHRTKTFQGLLDSADLEDQVCAMTYSADTSTTPPPKNHDPGRVRYEPFFLKMYGHSAQKVADSLVEISWLPRHLNQKIKVSKINGVAEKLSQISAELDQHPEWIPYLKDPGGTFLWRKISGTNRLSTHSFGITIDINIRYSNYWQWDHKDWATRGENINLPYINRIPLEIVRIFERHGFIWGGKWYHYDTMHFEYRPELLTN